VSAVVSIPHQVDGKADFRSNHMSNFR
jgi:hypothetical protein